MLSFFDLLKSQNYDAQNGLTIFTSVVFLFFELKRNGRAVEASVFQKLSGLVSEDEFYFLNTISEHEQKWNDWKMNAACVSFEKSKAEAQNPKDYVLQISNPFSQPNIENKKEILTIIEQSDFSVTDYENWISARNKLRSDY